MATLREAATGLLDRANARRPWSHNDAYRGFVLRNARRTAARRLAIDLGCGTGNLLLALAGRYERVLGVERDPATADLARRAAAGLAGVEVRTGDLLAPLEERADLVTCVAALHHVPLTEGVAALRRAVAPGGRLVVVGVHRGEEAGPLGMLSTLLNPLVGLVRHPRGAATPAAMTAPTAPTIDGFDEVRRVLRAELPGARIRTGPWWRWTAVWTAPR